MFDGCRCTCGGMDLSTEKGQNLSGVHNQQPCLGFLVIAVNQVAGTTLTIPEPNPSKISEPSKLTTKESTELSHLYAGNVERPLL